MHSQAESAGVLSVASRKYGRAKPQMSSVLWLSIPHSVSQSVSMRDYYINYGQKKFYDISEWSS
jgi:hypothetical protein